MTEPPEQDSTTSFKTKVEALLAEVAALDDEARELRLAKADQQIATAVRAWLLSEAGTVAEPVSGDVTLPPSSKAAPLPGSDRPAIPDLPPGHRRLVGRRLGPYTIRRLIGSGGMGQVWEARQEKPNRSIALKLIRSAIASPAALERFRFEVEVLGRLKHPGIAQIYDAGSIDLDGEAVPYFAMEYVASARPLNEYARKKKLSIRARLRLFSAVCDAISHGHQRGIVHRDLKPANILVDSEGNPKIIDFGVARATDVDDRSTMAQTMAGQLIGTLQYMSPEQCAADPDDIDVRADVYSLGVILFELLADRLPYDLHRAAVAEAIRVIQEETPPRLSSFQSDISMDIEVIAGKAMEKDRVRRYRTAGELADDVRRFLADEPITARPPSMSEVLRRYARKNRPVAAAILGISAAVVIGVIGIAWFAVEADQERFAKTEANLQLAATLERETTARELAETRFEQVRELANEMLGPIALEIKNLAGGITAREMLVEAGKRYLAELEAQEDDPATLQLDIAKANEALADLLGGHRTGNLGRADEALEFYESAIVVFRMRLKNSGDDHAALADISRLLSKRADIEVQIDPEKAFATLEEARVLATRAFEATSGHRKNGRRLGESLSRMGDFHIDHNQSARALIFFQQSRDIALALLESTPDDLILQRDVALRERRIGFALGERDDIDEAKRYLASSLQRIRAIQKAEPDSVRRIWDTSWGCYFHGILLAETADNNSGPILLLESVELITVTVTQSPREANYRDDLARIVPSVHETLRVLQRTSQAEEMLERVLLKIQPIVESMPENLALVKIHADLYLLRTPDETR